MLHVAMLLSGAVSVCSAMISRQNWKKSLCVVCCTWHSEFVVFDGMFPVMLYISSIM